MFLWRNKLAPYLELLDPSDIHIIMMLVSTLSYKTGPSCSKLTMSLVNDLLKFRSSDTRIC